MRAVIAAILEEGQKPIESEQIEAFVARAKLLRDEPPQITKAGPVVLIRCPIRPSEPSPIARESGVVVILDGTVDNRIELARELELSGSARDVTSERVIAAAYERWGEDAPARLIGELAFLLWDPRRRRLLAARDALGMRQLFFHPPSPGRGRMYFSSQLQMLQGSFHLSDLDQEYVADFLVDQVHVGPRTAFRSVRRLEAGSWLSLWEGKLEICRYWRPVEKLPHKYADPKESAEHFREVFREAVRRCLGTGGRAWAELSGGLDSSSIVCMAQEILQEEPQLAPDFGTVSFVWEETPQSDERRWIQPVVEKYGVVNDQLVCDDHFFDGALEAARYRSDPHFGLLCHPMYRKEERHLRSLGVDTLLSGSRAEAVVLAEGTPPVHLADLLRSGHFGTFFRTLSYWQTGTHKPLVNLAYSFGLRPLLRRDLYIRSIEDRGIVDPWIREDFARCFELRDRARKSILRPRFRSRAQGFQAEGLLRSEQMVVRGALEWSFEIRHPFMYLPLVELALQIPWEQKVEPALPKPLLRRALGEILPERVRQRRGALGPGPSAYKAYARRWAQIEPVVRSPVLASLGLVDQEKFYRAAEMIRFGASPKFGAFTTCLGLEYWLRATVGEDEVE